MDYTDLLSGVRYDKESKSGKIKVVDYVGLSGKTHYYNIKFQTSGNIKKVSRAQILNESAIDTEYMKAQTKKKKRDKKKEIKTKKEWTTKYLHNTKNILVLDLASESSGYCVVLDNKISDDYGYFYHEKSKSSEPSNLVQRLNYMKHCIIAKIKEYNIDSVVIESLIFKGSKHVLFVLSQIRILVLDYCYDNEIPCISVHPLSWENSSNKGRFKSLDTKERSLKSALVDYDINFKQLFKGENDNETNKKVWEDVCDAYLLAQYVIKNRIE